MKNLDLESRMELARNWKKVNRTCKEEEKIKKYYDKFSKLMGKIEKIVSNKNPEIIEKALGYFDRFSEVLIKKPEYTNQMLDSILDVVELMKKKKVSHDLIKNELSRYNSHCDLLGYKPKTHQIRALNVAMNGGENYSIYSIRLHPVTTD